MTLGTGMFLRSPKALIVFLASICALVLVVGAARKGGNGPRKQDGTTQIQSITPHVHNKTRSFELTQKRLNRGVGDAGPELSLRNGYDKNVTAFAVSVNGLIALPDFLYSENEDRRAIAPGAVYTSGVSYVDRSFNRGAAARDDFDINVLAVVFDDKTSDGDEKAVAFILNQRLNSKRLLTRIVDLLNEDVNSLRSIDDTVSSELRSRISSLSNDPADSSDINDVLRWLDQADHGQTLRKRMVGVKETCKNLLGRL